MNHPIFLDVGGHKGETLEEVLRPEYAFSVIHCFEPSPSRYQALQTNFHSFIETKKLILHNFALGDRNQTVDFYGVETIAASIYRNHRDIFDKDTVIQVEMRAASEFFHEFLSTDDPIIMKLNCEGSEGIILKDLASSGAIHRIQSVLIDFDLFKIKGMTREVYRTLRSLKKAKFKNFVLFDTMIAGKYRINKVRYWLSVIHQRIPVAHDPAFFVECERYKLPFVRRIKFFRRYIVAYFFYTLTDQIHQTIDALLLSVNLKKTP